MLCRLSYIAHAVGMQGGKEVTAENISAFRPLVAEALQDRSRGVFLGLAVCRVWVYTFFLALGDRVLVQVNGHVASSAGSTLFFAAGAVLALALALGSQRVAPWFVRHVRHGVLVCGLLAAVLLLVFRLVPSPSLALVAAVLGGLVLAMLRVAWGCAYGGLETRLAGLYIALSFFIAVVVTVFLKLLPSFASLVALFALPPVAHALLGRVDVLPACGSIPLDSRGGVALRPFWPLAVSMFVFVLASVVLRSLLEGDIASAWVARWQTTVVDGIVSVLFVLIYLLFKRMDPLPVYRCVIPLIVVGYTLFPLLPGEHRVVGTMFAAVGYGLFDLLSWAVMVKFVHDGRGDALRVFGFGVGATLAGRAIGTIAGDLCAGLQVQGVLDLSSVSLVMTFVLVLVCVTILPESVFVRVSRPAAAEDAQATVLGLEGLRGACRSLAAQSGLTPRETDVLLLLARGRNAQTIARELQIASGTVQTHIKHIYGKTDLHTQQELIDCVESIAKEPAGYPLG